jgi:hypothetical protein
MDLSGAQRLGWPGLAAALALAMLALPGPARADHQPNTMVMTVSDRPDPAPSTGEVLYEIKLKNDGRQRSFEVLLAVKMPPGAEFVRCATSIKTVPCQVVGATVTASFGEMRAHATVKMSLTVLAPVVDVPTQVELKAGATGEDAHKGSVSHTTLVLPQTTRATLLPSGRVVMVRCGQLLDPAFFAPDTTVKLLDGMSCARGSALRVAASNVIVDLGGKKVVGAREAGNVGVLVMQNAVNVRIRGSGIKGTQGIEFFDWCIRDEGGNTGLVVEDLRCFRARSAGIDLVSSSVLVDESIIDLTQPLTGMTAELEGPWPGATPGGVGIRLRGDNARVNNTEIRRSEILGLWASGTDTDLSDWALQVEDTEVQSSFGVGVLLTGGGPHRLENVSVEGDGVETGRSTDGVVVASTVIGATLDGVVVKLFPGNGILVDGPQAVIERSEVENVGGAGFVIGSGDPTTPTGQGAYLSGNTATETEDGFVVLGDDVEMESNEAEEVRGNGFVVGGARFIVVANTAEGSGGHGFIFSGSAATTPRPDGRPPHASENDAIRNGLGGILISGHGNLFRSNVAASNTGVGIEVSGSTNTLTSLNKAERNAAGGLLISGADNLTEGTVAASNTGIGMHIPGTGNRARNNTKVERNSGFEWVIGANNVDQTGNKANGGRLCFPTGGGSFEGGNC